MFKKDHDLGVMEQQYMKLKSQSTDTEAGTVTLSG